MSGKAPIDPGFGPPPGSVSATPGPVYDLAELGKQARAIGTNGIATNDPGFAPPTDPIKAGDVRGRAQLVYRDIPLVTVQNSWTVDQTRAALAAHTIGQFETSAQLADAILGDDRVTATLGSRVSGLFGREVRFKPGNDSSAARECLDAWQECWPAFSGDGALAECHVYGILMGWSAAQPVWDTTTPIYKPSLRPWHPRYSYYHWPLRRYIALSQDGQIAIEPGNGKWMLHAPFGAYRGWIRGTIRALAEPWLLRHFAFRDMARYSEVHGMPTRVGEVPAASDPEERSQYAAMLSQLGSETTLLLSKGVDQQYSYGFRLEEAKDTAWEVFPGLIDRCDMAIVLAIMFQNLTTEVKGGSYGATTAHMDIRESGLQADNAAWKYTLYNQVARVFAYLNFGDADLAPWTDWDVEPRGNYETNAKQFQQFGIAIDQMARGGVRFRDVEELRKFAADRFGLNGLPAFDLKEPVAGGLGGAPKSKLPFTDVDPADVVTVNEARELNDLPAMDGGDVTINQYHSDQEAERARATDAAKAKAVTSKQQPTSEPPNEQ